MSAQHTSAVPLQSPGGWGFPQATCSSLLRGIQHMVARQPNVILINTEYRWGSSYRTHRHDRISRKMLFHQSCPEDTTTSQRLKGTTTLDAGIGFT